MDFTAFLFWPTVRWFLLLQRLLYCVLPIALDLQDIRLRATFSSLFAFEFYFVCHDLLFRSVLVYCLGIFLKLPSMDFLFGPECLPLFVLDE